MQLGRGGGEGGCGITVLLRLFLVSLQSGGGWILFWAPGANCSGFIFLDYVSNRAVLTYRRVDNCVLIVYRLGGGRVRGVVGGCRDVV